MDSASESKQRATGQASEITACRQRAFSEIRDLTRPPPRFTPHGWTMSRITLAFGCFFKLLFGGTLPARAADYLPEGALPKTLPEPSAEPARAEPEPAAKAKPEAKPRPSKSAGQNHRDGSLAMLALLQREGRLVDFLQEDVDDYEDADIGAAVRDIHRGCRKVLRDHLTLEAVMPGEEDDKVSVPEGFDPGEVKLIGDVHGDPPFQGVLRHHGWRVAEVNLPKLSGEVDRRILAPAQVEVQ